MYTHISWYRSRKFWAVLIVVEFLVGMAIFLPNILSQHPSLTLVTALMSVTGYSSSYYLAFGVGTPKASKWHTLPTSYYFYTV